MPSAEKPEVQVVEEPRQEISVGETQIVTMADLIADPTGVIEQVNESKNPAAITRNGEFLALILPLAGTGVQHLVFTQKQDLSYFAALIDESDKGPYYSAEELESELGVSATDKSVGDAR